MNILTTISPLLGLAMCVISCIPSMTTVKLADKIGYKLGDTVKEEVIDSLIVKYATGSKAFQMKRTLYCESAGFQNIQSKIKHDGVLENSWGIAQINLDWNKSVTKEQALDPDFSVKWMSEHWKSSKWYGYDKVKDTCNIIYQ